MIPLPARPGAGAAAPAGVSILVVDDNVGKRAAISAMLSPLGHTVVEADSGLVALRCLLAQDFAVILLDVQMPIMDGFETAALIRLRKQSEMTPIIFITAFGADEVRATDRYSEGAVDFMFAPVQPDELRAKVSVFANLFLKAEALAAQALEVEASAAHLRLLTDAAPIGIFQTDAEGRLAYTNPQWSEITGLAAEAAAGKLWNEAIPLSWQEGSLREAAESSESLVGKRFEIPVEGAAPRIALVTARCMHNSDGGMAGWVGTLSDVTSEAGAETAMSDARDEANEASRMKSDFLANMSHEIRTPMNGVIGMTDLLLETDLDTQQRDYAQTVRNSGEALLTIIGDILDFSKVEAGKLEIEEIDFDLRAVIDDVADMLAGPAQAKGLELVTHVAKPVPAVVNGDPGRIRQVLTNLLSNAIKFTQVGEIVIRVSANETPGGQVVLRFEVSDTGDGIAADKLDVVFQPFMQADTSTSRKYGGTGLGLAISSHLVALMGGDCGVASRLGEGSDFWFTVRARAHVGQATHRLLSRDAGLAGVTALIVDDNATQCSVLSEYMTDWGMTVTTADSARSALATLRTAALYERPFAVALVDRYMPEMDGLELKDAIAGDPGLDPRVVLMTGQGEEQEELTKAGVCAAFSKPVRQGDLQAALRVALGLQFADEARPMDATRNPAWTVEGEAGRLLLAEDNLINQKVAVAMLSSAGYQVDTVANGALAVAAAAAHAYDAILMDCQMPELNGYEATAAIRAQEGPDRHIPIIAMTAGARREDRERCFSEGMDGFLAKPVSKDALLALVARSLKDRAATVA
jgi:PAS domain S-box-containing protein